jgi:rhodanese-related sulfurtransferase
LRRWALEETTPQGHRRLIRGCDIFQFAGDKIRKKDAFRKVFNEEQMRMPNPSPVSAVAFADPQGARRHFEHRLACETDCADVWKAIDAGTVDFVLVDCRPAGNYAKAHLPGAISLPWSEIDEARVRDLPDLPVVTYCWGPSCNAATKGAYRLAALGREVKEMIGGLEYWIREGHPTEGKRPVERGQEKPRDWGLVV